MAHNLLISSRVSVLGEDMHWRSEREANEWPIVILFLSVHLFTVVFQKMSLSQAGVHLSKDGSLSTLLGANETNNELLLNAEAENTLDVGTNDLEVHESGEAVLE